MPRRDVVLGMLCPQLARILTVPRPILALLVVTFTAVWATAAQDPAKTGSAERQRGIQLYADHKDREAIEELRNAVKLDKDDGDAWYYLGLALVRVDDMKAARKAFESAVRLKPDFAAAHTGYAYASMATGKDREVEREAAAAIRLNQADATAHYLLGVVELRDLKAQEAL